MQQVCQDSTGSSPTVVKAFFLCFCILQAIINLRWERPGNELSTSLSGIFIIDRATAGFSLRKLNS